MASVQKIMLPLFAGAVGQFVVPDSIQITTLTRLELINRMRTLNKTVAAVLECRVVDFLPLGEPAADMEFEAYNKEYQ